MNKSLLIFATVAISFTACSQHHQAPEQVVNAFNNKFPDIKKVEWKMEDDKSWEAEFKLNGEEYSAVFDLDGNWLETEHELKKADIPAFVLMTLAEQYDGYKLEEAELVEKPTGTLYEVSMEKGETTIELLIDMNGKVVEQSTTEEDND